MSQGERMFVLMRPQPDQRTDTGTDALPSGGAACCRSATHAADRGAATRATTPSDGFTSRTAARLAEATGLAASRDRLMGRLVRLLIEVKGADDLAEVTGGMSLHVWLQHEGRCHACGGPRPAGGGRRAGAHAGHGGGPV
jgi:hypothetical protein